jgi:hypothetical protein
MYSNFAFWLYGQIETLAEPTRFFAYIGLYVGIPILLVFLLWLDRKLETKK